REWARGRRTAKQRDERAPVHCRSFRAFDRKVSTPQLRQEPGALRDFNPAFVRFGSILLKKDFEEGLRAILIQDQGQMRNLDSKSEVVDATLRIMSALLRKRTSTSASAGNNSQARCHRALRSIRGE